MKKICLLLVVTLLLTCCGSLVSCNKNSDDNMTEKIEIGVKRYLVAKISMSTLEGSKIHYVDCTFEKLEKNSDESYNVKGEVTVKKDDGSLHCATYYITLSYDEVNDEYDLGSLEIGTFERE